MVPRYERLYERKYPPSAYRKEVQGMVRALQQRYGLTRRENADAPAVAELEGVKDPEQVGFAW
jgi:hypothetical protein